MNCQELEDLLFADRAGDEEAAARNHARRCPRCAQRLSVEDSLMEALRMEADEVRGLEPSSETDLKVLEAFRNRPPATRFGPFSNRWPAAVAAAVLLAALIAVASYNKFSGSEETAGSERSDFSGVEADGRELAEDPSSWSAEADLATDFFALTSCPELRCLEGAQHFRVRLPESSMTYFGLPVSDHSASAQIDADVLVGVDGVARAIRFVRPVSLEVK